MEAGNRDPCGPTPGFSVGTAASRSFTCSYHCREPTARSRQTQSSARWPCCRRALDGELYFYGRTLGFPASMPDDLEPIELVNV
jgi:hypothetical protein